MERNKNFDAGCYDIRKIKIKRATTDLATIIFWVILMCWCVQGLTGCTVSASLDWNGKSEIQKTTKSPEKAEGHTWW